MSSDVTVVGAGIFGLACAWGMARRGARVRVLEARRVGAGSSGGNVGALAPHAPEAWNDKKQAQFDSLAAAEAFWAGVAAAGGVDPGYARLGRLQPAGDRDRAEARIAGAAAHWPGFRMRLVEGPAGPLAGAGTWLHDDLSARITPRRALAALVAALRARGATIEEGCGPLAPGAVAGPVLWATGAPGLADLGRDLGHPAGDAVKGQSALLRFDAGATAQVYIDGLHVVPHEGAVAVGSTSERVFADDLPDDGLDAVIARARALVPALALAPVVERWAGLRPRATSRAPLLGAWPGRRGDFVANGGFKIGFGMAPWVAEAMTDLMLDGRDRVPEAWRIS